MTVLINYPRRPSKGDKPFKIQWTLKDSLAAQKQGWDLFDAGERFEIEVVTEHPAGFAEGQDDDAVAWIIKQALRGNKTCIKGLIIAGLLDPQWFAADLTHQVKTGRITVMDTKKQPSQAYSTVEYRGDNPKPSELKVLVLQAYEFMTGEWEPDDIGRARFVSRLKAASE